MQNKNTLQKIGTWLIDGDKGQSSESLLSIYLGGNPERVNWPYDAFDLRRCMAFLELLPEDERMPLINSIAARNLAWKSIQESWIDIVKLWEKEKYTDMPRLHKLMQDIYVKAVK